MKAHFRQEPIFKYVFYRHSGSECFTIYCCGPSRRGLAIPHPPRCFCVLLLLFDGGVFCVNRVLFARFFK